ncbi:hypothetical protein FO519_009623 [Halicephalobus sp. NKZ332]|nr:hypothetical protein FO519_009623 [Halicephalobus sp. NKZ332]
MSKKFTVDGRDVWVNEADFDYLREIIEHSTQKVQIDDLKGWETQVNYDEKAFLLKTDEYFHSHDYVQAHEKLWAAASYSVKKYFLRMGVKLASHNAKKHAVMTMIDEARKLKLVFNIDYFMAGMLSVGWKEAESAGVRGWIPAEEP